MDHRWEPCGINKKCSRCGVISLGVQFDWLIGDCIGKRKPTKRASKRKRAKA